MTTSTPLPGPEAPDAAGRLSHADLPSPHELAGDCRAASGNLARAQLERATRAAFRPAPSIRYEDYPAEIAKPEIRVSEAAARLAAALHLD